jgi:hypothetical protein
MAQRTIEVDERLNETTALQLAADLNLLDPLEPVLLDFSRTCHFEPFGMLFVSARLNRLRRRAQAAGASGTGRAQAAAQCIHPARLGLDSLAGGGGRQANGGSTNGAPR